MIGGVGSGVASLNTTPEQLAKECQLHIANNARLLTFFGADERADGDGFAIYAVFLEANGATTALRARVDPERPSYPAVTSTVPEVHWDEREMRDLLGIQPDGHPDSRRLVLREDWPDGLYPLRKDFDPSQVPPAPRELETFTPLMVEGEGVVGIPVGPIHAGIIEPGHFRFSAVGESVLHLDTRLFYTHRGIERLAEGRTPEQALPLVERICGACACSNAVAFCAAVESLAGVTVPQRARLIRTLLLELERLYNHVGDAGNICAGVGFAVGAMQGALLKEQLQALNERLVGHRFLRGTCAVGGLRRDLADTDLAAARAELTRLHRETRGFMRLLVETDALTDRMRRTGVLSADTVRIFGGVGVAARASGVDTDLRRDRPYAAYEGLPGLHVPLHTTGDAEARLRQRLAEAIVSFRLADEIFDRLQDGHIRAAVSHPVAGRLGVGATESPRGANVHAVLFDESGRLTRYRVRSASFPNWPLVAAAVPGNLLPDFPLINKSFELCYACLDR